MTPIKAATPDQARTAYLVLGMHRSGTSAVTQLLGLAGAELPRNVMPGDEHNAKGYFEPWKVAIFNDERLRAGGSAWDDVFAFPYRPLDAADEQAWRERARKLIDTEFGQARYPLLKDPRVSVLGPLWLQGLADLDIGVRAVIPIRHPLAVAGSLKRRDDFVAEKSVLLWAAYMLAAEAYSRDLPRAFVDYDALLSDWRAEVARMEAALGEPLPNLTQEAAIAIDGFLSPDLRHNAGDGDMSGLGWAGALAAQVLDALTPAARGGKVDIKALDRAAAELARRQGEFGMLVSPAARDADALRAELREALERVTVLEAQLKTDRDILETGWREDVKRLELQLQAAHHHIATTGFALDKIVSDSWA